MLSHHTQIDPKSRYTHMDKKQLSFVRFERTNYRIMKNLHNKTIRIEEVMATISIKHGHIIELAPK